MRQTIPSADVRLEVLNDHYKDTITRLNEFIKGRDRLFVQVALVLTLLLFDVFSPGAAGRFCRELMADRLKVTPLDAPFIGSLLWFALLYLTMRYTQTTVHIERQYDYVTQLEEQLGRWYQAPAFTREGRFYLSCYPRYSDLVHALYQWAFPAGLLAVAAARLWCEWRAYAHPMPTSPQTSVGLLLFDLAAGITLAVLAVLYLRAIRCRK